jgi:hypothetical protein
MMDSAVHMGEPPPNYDLQEWNRTSIHFHGFAGLPKERGAMVESDTFTNLGHQWRFVLYAGGDYDAEQGMISVELIHMSVEHVQIACEISFRGPAGPKPRVRKAREFKFDFDPTMAARCLIKDFAERNYIMNSLVDGTLPIVVSFKLADPTKVPFIPENPSSCNYFRSMFMDEESSDVMFEVGGQRGKYNAGKVARTPLVLFHAHKFILRKCSSVFTDLLGSGEEGTAPIQIADVSPDIFRLLLFYIYGGSISDDDMREHRKEIIHAADRFGVPTLKLEAEARKL